MILQIKDIHGYLGLYQITNTGMVWSVRNKKFMNLRKNKDGYILVDLRHNGKRKTFKVHRLVADAFLPHFNASQNQVNHIDHNKSNNFVNNLEWVTAKQNNNHALVSGRYPTKVTVSDVIRIRHLYNTTGTNITNLALQFNVSERHIRSIINRTAWKTI